MAYWWVNHKQTRNHEVHGGYLWSPLHNANGRRNQSYDNMALARPGDIVFSYADGRIGAIGQVIANADLSPKPTEFGTVGNYWNNEGWLVAVQFHESLQPIRPKDHITSISPLLPAIYSPIQSNGHGNQGIYLAAISDALGEQLIRLLRVQTDKIFAAPLKEIPVPNENLLNELTEISNDSGIPETQRIQLTKARVGQGLFRNRVMLRDQRCRVTGVSDPRLLIASHIKPWKESTNAERLDGDNGILLSPHFDRLFDAHLISFGDDGEMLFQPSIAGEVIERWKIPRDTRVARFSPAQANFLAHHRRVFAGLDD